jgi:hypothetical protein
VPQVFLILRVWAGLSKIPVTSPRLPYLLAWLSLLSYHATQSDNMRAAREGGDQGFHPACLYDMIWPGLDDTTTKVLVAVIVSFIIPGPVALIRHRTAKRHQVASLYDLKRELLKDDRERRQSKRLAVAIVGAELILVVGIIVVLSVQRLHGQPNLVVPRVTGVAAARAVETLRAAGFEVTMTWVRADDKARGQVLTMQPPPQSAVPRGSTVSLLVAGAIAFSSDGGSGVRRPEQYEIYVSDATPTSSQSHGLKVENLGPGLWPAWSPDGTRIAYAAKRPGHSFALYVRDLRTGSDTTVTADRADDTLPAWSPDGKRLVYRRGMTGEIYVVDARGVFFPGIQEIPLTNGGMNDRPAWSITDRIAFESHRSGTHQIYVLTPGKTHAIPVTTAWDNTEPAWSPDGLRLAFVRTHGGRSDIFLMDHDGANQCQLTSGGGTDRYPVWSPDGSMIIFERGEAWHHQIYLVPVTGCAGALPVGGVAQEAPLTGPQWDAVNPNW